MKVKEAQEQKQKKIQEEEDLIVNQIKEKYKGKINAEEYSKKVEEKI